MSYHDQYHEIDGTRKEFIVDTKSPVTMKPQGQKIKSTEILPMARKYRDVKKNEKNPREKFNRSREQMDNQDTEHT